MTRISIRPHLQSRTPARVQLRASGSGKKISKGPSRKTLNRGRDQIALFKRGLIKLQKADHVTDIPIEKLKQLADISVDKFYFTDEATEAEQPKRKQRPTDGFWNNLMDQLGVEGRWQIVLSGELDLPETYRIVSSLVVKTELLLEGGLRSWNEIQYAEHLLTLLKELYPLLRLQMTPENLEPIKILALKTITFSAHEKVDGFLIHFLEGRNAKGPDVAPLNKFQVARFQLYHRLRDCLIQNFHALG